MATLICDQCPLDRPDLGADTAIAGAAVYQSTLLRGLLKYGACQRYIFIDRNAVHSRPRAAYRWLSEQPSDRGEVATIPELMAQPPTGPIVLMTPDPTLHGLYGLQRLLRRFDTPCVGMVHSLNGSRVVPSLLGSILQRRRSANALVCSSDAGRIALERQIEHVTRAACIVGRVPPFRCPVIPLGVDSEYFQAGDKADARRHLGIRPDEVAILSIGRFSSRTKADLRPLLVAFAEVRRSCRSQVRLFLAGDDTQEREMRSLIGFCRILGLEPLVSLHPHVPHSDKLRLLAASDVFVAISDNVQETFGLSVVEAMAAGLPVVAADWDGLRETVVHGETGFLVSSFMPHYRHPIEALSAVGGTLADSLTAQTTVIDLGELVSALQPLVDDVALRRRAGEAGRTRAERLYHLPGIVARHEQLWAALLADTSLPDSESEPEPVFSYSCSAVFGHYATAPLRDDARIAMTELGERCLREPGHGLLASMAGSERVFRQSDLEDVLGAVRDAGTITIRDVCHSAGTASAALVRQAATARLLKYGVIRISSR